MTFDSVKVPVPVLRKIMIAAEQKKILEAQVIILDNRISVYQKMVSTLEAKDSVTVKTYESQVRILNEEKSIYVAEIKTSNRAIKILKRRLFVSRSIGLLTGGLSVFLLLTR